jgi:hypothetical protein
VFAPARAGAPIRLAQDPQLPPPSTAVPAPPVVLYQDALIDPAVPVDLPYGFVAPGMEAAILPGGASAEYRYFNQNTAGAVSNRYTEHGLTVEARQDTRNYGRFEARGVFTDATNDGTYTNIFTGGTYANLTQRDFALTDRWVMTNELGHIRARVPELLSQGYRIRLPEPLIQGAFSESRSADTTLRLGGGTLGTYQGRTFPVFTTDFSSGSVVGASASTRFNPQWQGSAQVWQANDALTAQGVRSFTSAAGVARYNSPEGGTAQANVLNGDGKLGLWFDGEKRFASWLHNAGAYRMDPTLEWIDRNAAILTDVQGVYWRGATRSFRTSYSLGADWSQSNIDGNSAIPTRTSSYAFGNVGYRSSPTFDVTGYLSLGQEVTDGAGVDTRDSIVSARGTASNRFSSGTSIWGLGLSDRSGANSFTRYDGNWDHFWNPVANFTAVRTGIAYVQQSGAIEDYRETQLRLGGGWNRNGLNLGANATLGYLTGDVVESSRTATVTAFAGWQFAPAWRLGADLTYNQNALQVTGFTETRVTDRQVMLSVRYDASWGQPESAFGFANGTYGRGAVSGILFYDNNGNGIRDPDESGVPNVTIYLDRGFSVETNARGEFSFNPVASGDHQLSVNVANVPLPWTIDERRPFIASIRPRETTVVEIPLVRIGGAGN